MLLRATVRAAVLALGVMGLGVGCSWSDEDVRVDYSDHEVSATAMLTKVVHDKDGDFILGTITIRGVKKALLSADVHCFVLRIGESRSVDNWKDALITTAGTGYPAFKGEVVVILQLPMTRFRDGTEVDFYRARLERRPSPSFGECFKFVQ